MLRRDWLRSLLWIGVLTVFGGAVALMYPDLYPDAMARETIGATMQNPAMVAMFGEVYGLGNYTVGALYANQMFIFMLVFAALMNVFLITTHTRKDEEDGVLELIRAQPVGRIANLFSVFMYAVIVNMLFGGLMGFTLFAFGDASMGFAGSLLFGVSMTVIGLFFAALTAVFAQLFESSRTVKGVAFLSIGIFYMMRGIGDVSAPPLAYLSPFGLLYRAEVFVSNRPGFFFLTLLLALAVFLVAFKLNSVRDHGSGMIAARPGRREASDFTCSPLGFAFRLTRTLLIVWTVSLFVLGASYGSIFGDIDAFFAGNEQILELIPGGLEGDIAGQFMSTIMAVVMVAVNVGAMMIVLKLAGEEKKMRTEILYANNLRRWELYAVYAVLGVVSAFILAMSGVAGMYLAATATMDTPFSFYEVFQAGFTFFAPVLLLLGLGAALTGWLPRRTNLAWVYLAVAFMILYFGPMLDFQDVIMHLSPFEHMPRLPLEDSEPWSVVTMSVLSLGLFILGAIGYQKRDLTG